MAKKSNSWDPSAWKKDVVRWREGGTLYLSVPFTWMVGKAQALAEAHDGPVVAGGPAMMLMFQDGCDWAEVRDECHLDVLAKHNVDATFTTRGCIRRCKFCAVPQIEGKFRELPSWKPARMVCDNNLLAASKKHIERVIKSLHGIKNVDFNQGLDARVFTEWHAEQFAQLEEPIIRFAFDHISSESRVRDAVKLAYRHKMRNVRIYVLIGFKDTPEDAFYRLEVAKKLCGRTSPMRYQPLDTRKKNSYVAPGWTDGLLRDAMTYYSMLAVYGCISFDEYRERKTVHTTVAHVFGKKRQRRW